MLNEAIQSYRAAAAALPNSAPDDVMDAATARQDAALDDVCNAPCLCEADILAKLAIAVELIAGGEEAGDGTLFRAHDILSAIAVDLSEMKKHPVA